MFFLILVSTLRLILPFIVLFILIYIYAIDKTWKKLRFISTELVMLSKYFFKLYGKLNISRCDNILDFELGETYFESELLDDPCNLSSCIS